MIAVPLITGLTADHYEDSFHLGNPMIDKLRSKMSINEEKRYSIDYLDPDKRSIANAIKIEFKKDGTATDQVEVEYPIGHKNRRAEGIPVLEKKFKSNLATRFPENALRYLKFVLLKTIWKKCLSVTLLTYWLLNFAWY